MIGSRKRTTPASRTRVGNYEMGRTLGEGSFAKVKYARNTVTGDIAAIKILDRDKVLRHKMVEQLKREISTMKLIKHPNVVEIIEVMASKTKIYIVLELVNGGELFDKIAQQGRLKEDEARRYVQQLINAVDYCHSRGVYHRDLKPENLLLDANGVLKVSDFGLSAFSLQVREDGLLHTACGTPNYVAPEVLSDKGYDGAAADVWSCGVILFVLMAGYLPFDEPNLMTLYKRICKAEFNCPPWFSPGAKNVIKRILDPSPITRISIAELLEDEWFKQGYKTPSFEQDDEDITIDDVDAAFSNSKECLVTEKKEKPESMNAFELISSSNEFSLENLFEKQAQLVKKETRFTSNRPASEIMSKMEETAKPLGFNVRKDKYKIKMREQQTTTKQRKTERKTRQLNQSRESTREVRGHHKATRSVRHAMRRESVEATLNNMSHELVILASPSSPPKNISPITDLRCCASSTDTNARKKVAADENRNYSGRPTKHLSKHRLQLSPPPDLTPLLLLIEPHKHPISY